jgi:hypothetical protein
VSTVTVNNNPVTDGTFSFPRTGAWVADLMISGADAITGAVTVVIGDSLTLSGTVYRGGVYVGQNYLRVVGGKGGLHKDATPKHYKDIVPARNVISDLMADAGETLSATSDAALTGTELGNWTTTKQPVNRALFALMAALDPAAIMRVLPDGTIFLGADAFSTSALEVVLVDEFANEGKMVLSMDVPELLPGVTILGRKVSYVEHHLDSSRVRSLVWYEA